jgi:hypothetical protein
MLEIWLCLFFVYQTGWDKRTPLSAVRLIGVLLAEHHESWSTGKRYFDMTEYVEWRRPRRNNPWVNFGILAKRGFFARKANLQHILD